MRGLIIATILVVLAGCATKPQMTREEYLQTTQREYQGKTADDVLKAAEELFVLADGDDFTFHHADDSMSATRPWLVYLVLAASMGTDNWLVQTKEVPGGVKASAKVSTSMGSVAPMATTGGDWTATGMPGMGGNIVAGTAIYDVFWARMDYLLGRTDKWMTCAEADARVKAGTTWGQNEALCNGFNVKDAAPETAPR